jgi:Na+/proline symporter
MISSTIVIGTIAVYLLILFAIAYIVEKKSERGKNLTENAIVYTLALAIYCTAWTFFGNIGLVAKNSYLFIAVYIGPTIFFIFWWRVLRKLVRIRNEYNITSIADFISARYEKSSAVAAIAASMAFIGIVPYLSLQLKAMFTSYAFITTGSNAVSGSRNHIDLIFLGAIIIFIVVFGLRRLDQSERHPGMVMIIAVQSVVKLAAFLTLGIFVTYFLYHGFGDICSRVANDPILPAMQQAGSPSYSLFMAYIVLSMSAILFLPRQFHMAVVENTNEKYIRTAVWLLPLYFIAITIFVVPVAMVGILKGYDVNLADIFILIIPLKHGNFWLSLLVFIGGFSAAISMIMISAMTITTMVANHLILPLFERIKMSGFLRRHLLSLRWVIITLIMIVAYIFEVKIGSSYVLVKIGMISFAAALQFAPVAIGGLFWKKGSRAGAIMGLTAGFFVWIYTCLVPALIRSGWLSGSILSNGPFGLKYLRPENLFGITSLDPLAMTVIFTMIFNIGFYIFGSLFFGQSEREKQIADNFINIIKGKELAFEDIPQQGAQIDLQGKMKIIDSLFGKYLNADEAKKAVQLCLTKAGLSAKNKISIKELVELSNVIEKTLTSYIGSSSASEALAREKLFTEEESAQLSNIYTKMAADLKLTPEELSKKIIYYTEKEEFLKKQGEELDRIVKERTKELEEKNSELERFQDLTVGRELKMMELKEKIEELKSKTSPS